MTEPTPAPTEEDLAALAREGDSGAFEKIVVRYRRGLFALFLRSTAGNQEESRDLCQDTFLRVWRGLKTYDPKRPLRPWIYRIAVNVARSHARGRAARPILTGGDSIAAAAPKSHRPDVELEAKDARARVRQGVAALPDWQREVLLLRAIENLSYKEIGSALDLPIGTVMSRLARARAELRKMLGRDDRAKERSGDDRPGRVLPLDRPTAQRASGEAKP